MSTSEIKEFIKKWVDQNKSEFILCSQFLFNNPELGMQEFKAVKILTEIAAKHGFAVECGVAGMPTAFVATYGSGRPVIAFSAEYDALPGLSQKISLQKEPVVDGGPGHACGHNVLGAGALMAGIALRYALEQFGLKGTIKIFGTPAEEICIGKPFMAREGSFDGVDAFLDWHPYFNGTFVIRTNNAYFNKYYHFKGKTAHGNAPWHGRSTLDAAMLMGHAVEMLREHINPGSEVAANTVNYTFSDVGPEFPSVVPDHTTAWYVGRFSTMEIMLDTMERIDDCAKGAALATGTTVEMELVTAVHEKIPNEILGQLLHDNYLEVGPMPISEEEQAAAKKMQENADNAPVGIVSAILPPSQRDGPVTDISEYSWIAPLASIRLSVFPSPGHHWAIAVHAGSEIGKRAVSFSANLLARTGADLLTDPEILIKAWKEQEKRLNGRKYTCLIANDIKPPLEANKLTMERYAKN
jgi:aminobenzoyl-glutamate utilization protein B